MTSPSNRENCIDRIGSNDRFNKKGVTINFVISEDVRILRDIKYSFTVYNKSSTNVSSVLLNPDR